MKTNLVTNGIIAAVIAIAVSFGAYYVQPDIPDSIKGEEGKAGKAGPRGYVGSAGKDGKDGKDGKSGVDGKDAIVNINTITDAVVDEIEDREDRADFSYSGVGGSFTRTLNIDNEDEYRFTIKHFGSGDVDISMEDEGGDVQVFIDGQGHFNTADTRTLNAEEYILHISADGDWAIEVEQI